MRQQYSNTDTDSITCFYTNADSLLNKRSELLMHIHNMQPRIIAITEVQPKNTSTTVLESEFHIENYQCYLSAPGGRGVLLYIHNTLESMEVIIGGGMYVDAVWCTVTMNGTDKLLVGCVYRSPNISTSDEEQLNDMMIQACCFKVSHKLIMGDFNHPDIDWITGTCCRGPGHSAVAFLDIVNDAFLFQHCLEPTHSRPGQVHNTLDLVFTDEEEMIGDLEYITPLGKSQHVIIQFSLTCRTRLKNTAATVYRYDKADYDGMYSYLNTVNWDALMAADDVNTCWNNFEEKLKEARDKFVPSYRICTNRKKARPMWMNSDLQKAVKTKKEEYSRFRKSGKPEDYTKYKLARNKTKCELRRSIRQYERCLAKEAKKNPKAFYKYVNSKTKSRTGIPSLVDGDTVAESNLEKAEILNKYFSTVFTKETTGVQPSFSDRPFTEQLTDISFDENSIEKKLNSLKVNKTPGPDQLHPRLLKEMSGILKYPLQKLFSRCMDEGKVPETWKIGHVTPIFKKGKKCDPSNYRPISLTSIVCKTMESLVRHEIMQHLLVNELLSHHQHGFMAGRSCTTQLLEVLDIWSQLLDEGDNVDVVYLDFAKAFDTVPHRRMMNKLHSYGIRGKVWSWIADYMCNRKQCVIVNGVHSSYVNVTSGVPQGSVLGPLLFLIYINDLPEVVFNLVKLFADDTKLFARISSFSDCQKLQTDLSALQSWSKDWLVQFNISKCKILRLGSNPPVMSYSLETSDGSTVVLEESKCERDLGVMVDNELKFGQQVDAVVLKANRQLGLIKRSFTYLDEKTLVLLYTSLVRPLLEYANVAWPVSFKKDINKLERVQRRATRLLPHIRQLEYQDRLKILNLPSLVYRRIRGDMIEVYKFCHDLYAVDCGILEMADGSITRGHNYKLSRSTCRSRARHDYFSQRIVEHWNRLPSDVVNAPSVNSFKGRLDRHWKEFFFSLELPAITVASCH